LGGQAKRKEKMTRIVVCDTGPLLHLSEVGSVHLLSLAGDVFAPPLVVAEFESNSHGWHPPQWVKVIDLERSARQKAERWVNSNQIDAGEAEAIGLALQIGADWLLTDDAKARQLAESAGLEVHGSIGLILWAVATGHIEDKSLALHFLENLANSSLWVSDRVLQEARKAIDTLMK
jgi:predicted nucleic acid-binding protein